jgi:spore maturation protein CgeB
MLDRVCFLVHDDLYNSKREFAASLAGSLKRVGVETKTIDIRNLELGSGEIDDLYRFDPSFICTFNKMMPLEDGTFIWDGLKVPSATFLLDPAIYYLHLAKSDYSVLGYSDRYDDEVIAASGLKTHFFFPQAVDKKIADSPLETDRPYDVVLMGTCYDHERVRAGWENQYPAAVSEVIEAVVERTLAEPRSSFVQILPEEWRKGGIDPGTVDFQTLCTYIDYYLRGYDRFELLKSIKDAHVHVFGDLYWSQGKNLKGWRDYLKGMSNITVHDPVPYAQSFEILQKSKICLNSTPFIKNGSHDRLFTGLSSGCTVLTSENLFPEEVFGDGKGIEYYGFDEKKDVNDLINEILSDEPRRMEKVAVGKDIVRLEHTWDNRAELLLQTMPDMISEIYSKTSNPN